MPETGGTRPSGPAGPLHRAEPRRDFLRGVLRVPDSVRAPDGTPVYVVHGVLYSISISVSRLVTKYQPTGPGALGCRRAAAGGAEIIPSYEEHRVANDSYAETVSDTLTVQVPILIEPLTAVGTPGWARPTVKRTTSSEPCADRYHPALGSVSLERMTQVSCLLRTHTGGTGLSHSR